MTINPGSVAVDVADCIMQSAPWPALILTCDGRILRWSASAGALLDPMADGLDGLRLDFALDDQGLAGVRDLRITLAHDAAEPDAAAEIVLLNIGETSPVGGIGAGLAGVLGDAMTELTDMIGDRPGCSEAASLSRAVAAILAAGAVAPAKPAGVGCTISDATAKLLEAWRPRFAAGRRDLTVAIERETPEQVAMPENALVACVGGLLDLFIGDPAYGDVSVRAHAGEGGKALYIDIAPKAVDTVASATAGNLVAMLARLHLHPFGGDAMLSSPAPGEAMRLRLRMPARAGAAADAQTSRSRRDLPDLSNISILMAEDNLTNQLVASEMLKSMNATLVIASDGAEALEIASGQFFDLLLVDIEMPRVSGLEVIRKVRAAGGPQASRPIVALTAYAMNEHRSRIMEAGADGLIPKPILSIEKFGRAILGYLDGAAAPVASPDSSPDPDHDLDPDPSQMPPASHEVVDPKIYNALTDVIGPEATEELLDKIVIDLDAARREIAEGAACDDLERMRQATHILISLAGAVGAVRLQAMAERMNHLARDGRADRLRAETPEALTELDHLLEFIADKAGAFTE